MAEPALVTEKLTKRYGSLVAVRDLDLHVPRGAVFGFLGPNRAGKTTTIRLLLGLVHPTSGGARVLGHDIVAARERFLPQVGALVESPAFYPYLSGRDNLRILSHTGGYYDENRIDEVLDVAGLADRQRDRVRTYSMGMKQRLAVAATLLNRPTLLFLDEPTNGLDPAGQAEMRDLIKQLGLSGHTVFLSSHLLHEVELVCDSVAIIDKGQLLTQGRVTDLLGAASYLRIEAEPRERAYAIVQGIDGVSVGQAGSDYLRVKVERERVPEIVNALTNGQTRVYQVVAERETLEDVFLRVTRGQGERLPEKPGAPASAGETAD
ncbi:MAG TPA: ABC transporter ATP-binding protein [Anaerolineae bacterium]